MSNPIDVSKMWNLSWNGSAIVMDVMLKYDKPVGFCLLTDNTEQQSLDRAGGQYGNKGTEAMVAVLQMLQNKLS